LKIGGRPGTIRTKLAQRRPDKNPIFRIRPFLILPGVLIPKYEEVVTQKITYYYIVAQRLADELSSR
jgi:hypothetical protein